MRFRVGQKVVCVDADCRQPKGTVFMGLHGHRVISNGIMGDLALGVIYTIRDVTFGGRGVLLNEIYRSDTDPGYESNRFRPVVERKTDISIFTAMLSPRPRVDA